MNQPIPSPTWNNLRGGIFVLPMLDHNPSLDPRIPADGETVAWYSTTHSYISTYYAAIAAWRGIELTI